jgi:transcriptional regulator with XRE-family HTH domain
VRRRRKELGLTLEQLAERADMSSNYLGAVERGAANPSLSTVRAIAQALGISPGELFGEVQDLSPAAREVAALFELVSRDIQRLLLPLLRVLCSRSKA